MGLDAGQTDSEEMLEVFLGHSQSGRNELILEATTRTALRVEDWVLIPPYPGPAMNKNVNIELGNSEDYQLYNLSADLGQQNNLAESHPEKLKELKIAFQEIRGDFGETEQLELK